MTYLLLSSGPSGALLTDQPVIRREEVSAVQDAAELTATLDAHRQAVREAAYREGFDQGRAEGVAAAAAEAALALTQVHAALERERERLRGAAGTLALDIVRRIAAGLAPEEVLGALAEQAARDLLPEEPIRVRVAPDAAGAVQRRLWPLDARIEVVSDGDLPAGDCVLDTPSGRTHAGLEVQLRALETAFAARGEAAA